MKTLQLSVVSGEGEVFSGIASMVVLPGRMGELGITPLHVPLLTLLRPGTIRIMQADEMEQLLYVSGGYAEIQPHVVTVLADTVQRADRLDFERARLAREHAQKILARGAIGIDYAKAKAELAAACAQLNALEKLRRKNKY
jgi:F-type H+-transporting ATPase subunit epsilon